MFKYRNDVDGLRCIAVLSVIFYHIGFKFIPGGFLGVDVFFVISGYLITSISLKRLNDNSFTVIDFFKNRIRRIFPVLIFVLLFFTFFNLIFGELSAQELSLFLDSLCTSVFFVSNIFFTYNVGYFAVSTDLLHLVHTWSLAVEEQFYFIFPFIFLIFKRLNNQKIFFIILVIVVSSYTLKLLFTNSHPHHVFYLLPTRIWELGIGCIIPFIKTSSTTTRIKNIFYNISIFSIIFIFCTYNNNSYTIHFYPLLVCLFSFYILYYNSATGFVYNILTCKLSRTIGLMSFSLYLWHQPVFATIRNFSFHPEVLSMKIILFSFVVVFLLSYLSYIYVEKPFRQKTINVCKILVCYFILVLVIIFFRFNHYPSQTDISNDLSRDIARNHYDADVVNKSGYYFGNISNKINTKSVLLLGDSHARMLIPSLSMELKKIGYMGFHPSQNIIGDDDLALKQVDKPRLLKKWNDEIRRLSSLHNSIIISYRFTKFLNAKWNYHYEDKITKTNLLKKNLSLISERLKLLSSLDNNIIIIGPVPETSSWGPNLNRYLFGTSSSSSYEKYYHENKELLDLLDLLGDENKNVSIILPEHSFFDKNGSLIEFSLKNDILLPNYYDDDHLTAVGSSEISKHIIEKIKYNETQLSDRKN